MCGWQRGVPVRVSDFGKPMQVVTPLRFGTAEVAGARVVGEGRLLELEIRCGALNKEELGMLIAFLQAKRDQLDAP